MTLSSDALERLLRESTGPRLDAEPSRRAVRAALATELARRRQRDRRHLLVRVAVLALLLTAAPLGQLGSDDFGITIEKRTRSGREWQVYSQGFRGDEVWVADDGELASGFAPRVEEMLQLRASDDGKPVRFNGWQIGTDHHFSFAIDRCVDGMWYAESQTPPGEAEKRPAALRRYFGERPGLVLEELRKVYEQRAPDFTVPMHVGGLTWVVDGWRIRLPGRPELIYYSGLRADGVRSKVPADAP